MLVVSRRAGESMVLFDSHSDEVCLQVEQIDLQRGMVRMRLSYPDEPARDDDQVELAVDQQRTVRMPDGERVAVRNGGVTERKAEVSLRFEAKRCIDIFRAELV